MQRACISHAAEKTSKEKKKICFVTLISKKIAPRQKEEIAVQRNIKIKITVEFRSRCVLDQKHHEKRHPLSRLHTRQSNRNNCSQPNKPPPLTLPTHPPTHHILSPSTNPYSRNRHSTIISTVAAQKTPKLQHQDTLH